MEEKVVAEILEILGSEYSKKWSVAEKETKIKTWTMMLEDVFSAQGYDGLKKALNSPAEFMPSVGKFKQMCVAGAGKENFEDEAKAAWTLVIDNISTGSSPVFKDSCIAEAVRKIGGWQALGAGQADALPFRRRDFIDFYVVAKRSGENFYPAVEGHFPDLKFIGCDNPEEEKELRRKVAEWETREQRLLNIL